MATLCRTKSVCMSLHWNAWGHFNTGHFLPQSIATLNLNCQQMHIFHSPVWRTWHVFCSYIASFITTLFKKGVLQQTLIGVGTDIQKEMVLALWVIYLFINHMQCYKSINIYVSSSLLKRTCVFTPQLIIFQHDKLHNSATVSSSVLSSTHVFWLG